jgi:hypothetical protein
LIADLDKNDHWSFLICYQLFVLTNR